MAFRNRINICIALILTLLLTVSCGHDGRDELFVDFFSVSGTVFDKIQGSPIQDITVQMDAYSLDDTERKYPVLSYKCCTSAEGKYQFTVQSEENLLDFYFVFNLFDESTFRNIKFASAEERVLYLSTEKGSFFNPSMKSYEVTGNDFSLTPSGR